MSPILAVLLKVMAEWLWRYRSQSKVVSCDTPSYANDHLCLIWKNPFRTVCAVEQTRQDVPYLSSFIAKSWLKDFEDIGQGKRSLCATSPSLASDHLCLIWKESIQNCVSPVEQTWQDVPYFSSFIVQSWLNDLEDKGQGQRSFRATHLSC